MANNCLVTKLKSVVDNSSLPVLGVVDCILKKVSGYNGLTIVSGKQITITIPDGVDLWFGSSKTEKTRTFTGTGEPQYFTLSGDESNKVTCKMDNYWYLLDADNFGMDMKYWKYSPSTNIDITNGFNYGNIEELYKKTTMTLLNVSGNSSVNGSVNTLADKMYAAGRTSGSLTIYANGTSVKKDGVSFTSCIIDFTASGWSFQ